MRNLQLVKLAQEARQAFQASSDANKEMTRMMAGDVPFNTSVYDALRDVWLPSFERGMELDASVRRYLHSLKWRAA